MIMTDKRIMELANEVVDTYASDMLHQLGLSNNNDGILNRISVTDKIGDEIPQGIFNYVQESKGFMGMKGCSYVKESGNIEINVMQCLHAKINGKLRRIPLVNVIATLTRNNLKKMFVFILAHELRHYWQFYTGEIYETDHGKIGGISFMPYEWRWEEKDANEWARNYVKQTFIKGAK